MRKLILFLLLYSSTLFAQSPTSSPSLSPDEIKQLLRQLNELEALRTLTAAQEAYIKQAAEQRDAEKANASRALELEKQATSLAQQETALARRERDLAADKVATYEQLYRAATKKPGWGCRLKRFFTLGTWRCS